jgi:hypothetical protein
MGQISPYLATCKHMCRYQFFTGCQEQCLKLLSEQLLESYNIPKTGNSKEVYLEMSIISQIFEVRQKKIA